MDDVQHLCNYAPRPTTEGAWENEGRTNRDANDMAYESQEA